MKVCLTIRFIHIRTDLGKKLIHRNTTARSHLGAFNYLSPNLLGEEDSSLLMVNFMLNEVVCHVKVSLIKTDSLQVLIVLPKDRLEFFACLPILAEIRLKEEYIRTELFPYETW